MTRSTNLLAALLLAIVGTLLLADPARFLAWREQRQADRAAVEAWGR